MYVRVALAACLLVCSACLWGETPLPTATATIGSQTIELQRGSYCWSSGGHAACADSAGPDFLLEKGFLKLNRAAAGSKVAIAFQAASPLRDFHVQLVHGPSGVGTVSATKSHTFQLPGLSESPAGIYVYLVTGIWAEGDVSFFVAVELVP